MKRKKDSKRVPGKARKVSADEISSGKEEEQSLALLNDGDIVKGMDLKLDKNDIVAYQVSQVERGLEEKLGAEQRKADAQKKELASLSEKVRKAKTDLVKSTYEPRMKTAVSAISAMGIKCRGNVVEGQATSGHRDDCYNDIKGSADAKNMVFSKLIISVGNGGETQEFDLPPIKKTKSILDTESEARELDSEMTTTSVNIANVKVKLSQIDKLERIAKAKMAENILKHSKVGRAVLGTVSDSGSKEK